MNNKKLIIMFVAVLVIIIVIFNVILGLVGANKGNKSSSKISYTDKQYIKKVEDVKTGKVTGKYEAVDKNKSYYNLAQEDRDLIDQRIDYVLDLINNRKISEMYSLMHYDYKTALFMTEAEFEKYFDKTFEKGAKYYAMDFNSEWNTIYINIYKEGTETKPIVVELKNYTEEPYDSSKFEEKGTNFLYLYFGKVKSVEQFRTVESNATFEFYSDYCIQYDDKFVVVMHIRNKTNKDISLDFDGTTIKTLIGGNTQSYDMVTTRYVTAPAKSTIIYEMGFHKTKFTPAYIDLKADANGEKMREELYIIMPNDDSQDAD